MKNCGDVVSIQRIVEMFVKRSELTNVLFDSQLDAEFRSRVGAATSIMGTQ